MSGGHDELAFTRTLAALEFDAALAMIAETDPADRPGLEERVAAAKEAALDRAQQLASEIQKTSGRHDHRRLHAIATAPDTEAMLALLPEVTRTQSEILLRSGHRWGRRQLDANQRRLREARAALDRFDLELARGLLARIEPDFLGEQETEERDELLLALTSRSMEIEELSGTAEQIVTDGRPPRRRWWRRG